MAISEAREAEIISLALGDWDGYLPDYSEDTPEANDRHEAEWTAKATQFCQTNSNPEELHLFAQNVNWDFSTANLLDIVRNPSCDFGTAKMILRMSGLEYYQTFETYSDVDPVNKDGWTFIFTLLDIVKAKTFKTSNIQFDAEANFFGPCNLPEAKWKIPDEFC